MEPLIKRTFEIGASVKTIHNQLISYNITRHHNCIYPYHGIFKIQNGEYFIINISNPMYYILLKKGVSFSKNPIEDINILKYLINELYH